MRKKLNLRRFRYVLYHIRIVDKHGAPLCTRLLRIWYLLEVQRNMSLSPPLLEVTCRKETYWVTTVCLYKLYKSKQSISCTPPPLRAATINEKNYKYSPTLFCKVRCR